MAVPDSNKAVFISYAKQDAAAALRICEALRAAGIEVWFDQSELRGGDAWDSAIRRQIKTCALIIPVISANTRDRAEGYFRLEWKLAVDRSHLMSHDHAFVVPVVVDDTDEGDARVPDKFREVQWTRLPDGNTPPSFVERVQRLLDQEAATAKPKTPAANASSAPKLSAAALEGFEHEPEPKRPVKTIVAIIVIAIAGIGAWATRSIWHPAPVLPYSSEDRRMTYAVLPLQSVSEDAHALQIATATGHEILTTLEERHDLLSVISKASAEQAVAHETSMHKIAESLDVHFLIRGTVAKSGAAYQVTVACIDGDSERVLTTQTLNVAADELTPHWRDQTWRAVNELIHAGETAEVKRSRSKPPSRQDVRDLSMIANIDWWENRDKDGKAANAHANELLNRALALSPEDLFALRTVAIINLCDCVNSWSTNPEEQKNIGAAAMEKYLRLDPGSVVMLYEKASLYQLRLRWEESLAIIDSILAKEPTEPYALSLKASGLLRLGRLPEARSIDDGILARYPNQWGAQSSEANICYAQADYECAATMARKAVAEMGPADIKDRVTGSIALTLIAAEARLKHTDRAKEAIADFAANVPSANSIAAIKAWLHPSADLADNASLYEGLHMAGIGD